MIVSTKQLFEHAYGNYAVGAYNINNLEQTMGLFRGCIDSKAPFIIQISKGARSYTNKLMLEAMIRTAGDIFPDAIFAVHLDHGDEEACMDCIESGFYSSVMIDASDQPFDGNIETTKRVVDAAHAKDIAVEAELGQLGGVEEHVSVSEEDAHLTDPAQVEEFVHRTNCDSLACAIGTSHGAYKFTSSQGLHFEVIEEVRRRLPGFPIVMHGSSSVPQDEVKRINAAGGEMKGAKGVDEAQISKAGKMGVTKVNIDTDGRLVWCRVHREFFRDKPEVFDLRKPGIVFMDEYAKYIVHKNDVLGSSGKIDAVRKLVSK
ncbi:MAG: ketose-bisphosphate aldolase [Lentisphaerales bacterium]|jgi:fructose-bisphosphate aldolase class II|nr:MAG: ketose-bisphosphate aldolase [Lentisphaerales bacterium]